MGIEDKTVAEVMSRVIHTISINATFSEIIEAFLEAKVSALIVVAPNGEFMGIISKTDIILAIKKFGNKVWEKIADDILCPNPYAIEGSATIKEAARKMLKHKVHRLIVVTPSGVGKFTPVGVISATDILREFAS
jgi:CBS domain-containing protein